MVNFSIEDYMSPLNWHQTYRKKTVYLSSYNPSNEGHVSILANSMLRTYTSDIDKIIILRKQVKFLELLRKYPHILIHV